MHDPHPMHPQIFSIGGKSASFAQAESSDWLYVLCATPKKITIGEQRINEIQVAGDLHISDVGIFKNLMIMAGL